MNKKKDQNEDDISPSFLPPNAQDEPLIDSSDILDWSEMILQTIFELDKKYSRSLKHKVVVQVDEAEKDRQKSTDAFKYLTEANEVLIDASLYEHYVIMHDLREDSHLEQILKTEQRLSDFAGVVWKLAQPIVSVVGKKPVPSFIIQEKQEIYEKNIEPSFDEKFDFWSKIPLKIESKVFTFGDMMSLEQGLFQKLRNKRFRKDELEALLNPTEIEILSKMIAERKIIAILTNDTIFFTEKNEKNEKGISSSLLISPKEEE
ncbi:MAG: hypothetical protein ACTSPI_15055 [Candidatus Heimdallarchaeaceae archaeon]